GPKELKEDRYTKIESSGDNVFKLVILDTTVDDAGLYKVVASNETGTVTSEAKVIVQPVEEKPKIVKGLTNTEALVGNPVYLEIEVVKKPKVVKWYKNGQELMPTKHIIMHSTDDTHYRLIIPEAEQSDQADYRVKVENDVGSDESDARLTIRKSTKPKTPSPPKEPSPVDLLLTVVRGLENKKCTEEDGVFFEVEFSGKPVDVK
uniref:Ig-like domain-containing protein n=1 Tax=Romanomermis culicivorax TaxID=13658 RepID=A0A915KDA8_ROMCU